MEAVPLVDSVSLEVVAVEAATGGIFAAVVSLMIPVVVCPFVVGTIVVAFSVVEGADVVDGGVMVVIDE